MDAAAELGRNPVSKHQIQPEYGDEKADAGGTAEPVSRDQILRHERGQGNINFPCSADHEHDWQPYPVDPYSCLKCDYTHTQYPDMLSIVHILQYPCNRFGIRATSLHCSSWKKLNCYTCDSRRPQVRYKLTKTNLPDTFNLLT